MDISPGRNSSGRRTVKITLNAPPPPLTSLPVFPVTAPMICFGSFTERESDPFSRESSRSTISKGSERMDSESDRAIAAPPVLPQLPPLPPTIMVTPPLPAHDSMNSMRDGKVRTDSTISVTVSVDDFRVDYPNGLDFLVFNYEAKDSRAPSKMSSEVTNSGRTMASDEKFNPDDYLVDDMKSDSNSSPKSSKSNESSYSGFSTAAMDEMEMLSMDTGCVGKTPTSTPCSSLETSLLVPPPGPSGILHNNIALLKSPSMPPMRPKRRGGSAASSSTRSASAANLVVNMK